ncbi:TPA: type III restriction-modification system endonuclease [Listeria monocytogenes]|uniref:Type III restriction-modification system endonuclease n=1 Tax=Listeria monocytogenes TaxID=1639 RepID=A0A612SMK1_LISMN|nr:type III restriction-modification system endonuclease [Listeria monocytogenes]EAC6721263.1 type III restriction-modification system endonuclease [Listeria monocytogenes]EAD6497644.1 type III restriction-modification system endonuclease [Listeria monocytogenes]EAD6549166.1 type III restriction-modification system endonuclease [Listeria monocytogenes]EAD6607269.1 type III restriction-modification system endonuclease [Listeria monocytogenes]EAD7914273.1 type III restriction-modification system
MELILQRSLPHQQKAVDALSTVFNGVKIEPPKQYFENPSINLTDEIIKHNITNIQLDLPAEYRRFIPPSNHLSLDIKMETGTGKTYVHTQMMYELHKKYGINKFIIAVPSLAIKAGTAHFLQDEYVKKHFSDVCGYGTEIEVGVLESPKSRKKGRTYFPSVVSDFVRGSSQNTKKIHVLLVNMQLLAVRKNGLLSRDDYDYGAEGFYRPFDALKATKPFMIIDEPHRFSRDQKAYQMIEEEIQPQSIIRFGATYPDITSSSGKNRTTRKDYQNLLYDLNACQSFNLDLIKSVVKEHFEPVSKQAEKVKITTIKKNDFVNFQYKKKDEANKTFTLKKGDSLSVIHQAFEGITIDVIGGSFVVFSNGIEKQTGEELDIDIYMTSYQEQMMRLTLERHFETERTNFTERNFKIKTLALFFIDDIASYRDSEDGKVPYLKNTFEQLLKERIEKELSTLTEYEAEYKAYLEASLADISACHAGYFSQDNSDSDEDIANEVETILHGKKQLLSFKKKDDTPNTLRFLFSKWTLKEGWDNPNVFTIAKLRSSGSENSKLQEVGRGLRLPVDEHGNRISNEEFQLNYIVDFTEADFAERLVEQINGEIPQAAIITEEQLAKVASKLAITSDDLFDILYDKQYIDRQMNINVEKRDEFFAKFPEFEMGLSSGKVKDRNKNKPRPVKIRKGAYNEIRELWEKINQRYLLFYDRDLDKDMKDVLLSISEKQGVFTDVVMTSQREVIQSDGTSMTIADKTGLQYVVSRTIPYNEFLLRVMRSTNIPIKTIHQALCEYVERNGELDSKYINESSVSVIIQKFNEWKNTNLQGRFHYAKSETPVRSTALSYADGTPRETIPQGRIGTKIAPGTPSDKYLYDSFAYDSPLEQKNISTDIEEVIVYGKIPRNSIAIPTITGGMYSPDFMYVVRRATGEKELNIVVETKDVEDKTNIRGTENVKIECAKVFFDALSEDGYKVYFHDQLNNKQMAQIIKEVLRGK